jgi:hypothetical protein
VNVFHNGTPHGYIKVIIATDKVCKEGSKYCPVTKMNGHGTKECKVLLAEVKKKLALYESKTSFHNYSCPKTDYNNSKSEQMFSFVVNAFNAANYKERVILSKIKSAKQMRPMLLMMTYLMHSVLMMMSATKMKQTQTLMKKESAVAYCILNQIH